MPFFLKKTSIANRVCMASDYFFKAKNLGMVIIALDDFVGYYRNPFVD